VDELANEHAEAAVVSAMLQEPAASATASMIVVGADFTEPRYRMLFEAIVRLGAADIAVDPISIVDHLRDVPRQNAESWSDIVEYAFDIVPTAANVEYHARIVADLSRRRSLLKRMHAATDATRSRSMSLSRIGAQLREAASEIDRGETTNEPLFHTLRQLVEDQALLREPDAVVPNLAWMERVGLFVGREKLGKTSFLSFAASRLSTGESFLGHSLRAGRVLWVGLEEHPGDMVRRFTTMGADQDNILIVSRLDRGLESLEDLVGRLQPMWTVIDSLAALTEGMIQDESASAPWTPIMSRLSRIARDGRTAMDVTHHANKATGLYRGSTAIAAGVDQILTMTEIAKAGSCRRISAQGRWFVDDYSIRFDGAAFSLVGASGLSLRVRVLDVVKSNPGISKTRIRESLGANTKAVDAEIATLCQLGQVVHDYHGKVSHGYRVPSPEGIELHLV
jgi:hypothetical protein